MTKLGIGTYSLMIAVLLWGVLLGGVVYSNAIFMPAFLADLPASASVVNGPYAVNEGPFWGAIHPLVVLSLIVSIIANWRFARRRKLIAITLSVYIVILVITAFFFVPELFAFAASQQSNVPATELAARAMRWRTLSWVRGGLMFVLMLPLLWALVDRDAS